MAKYLLKSCCACRSLRTGTIISGVAAILLSIIGIILVFALRIHFRTIVFDTLDPKIVQAIITINLVMTILLTVLMLIGLVKRNWYFMIPWVVLGGILAIGLLVSIIFNVVNFFIEGENTVAILWLVFGLIGLLVYVYMWYVCFSFFINLKEEAERGTYSKDPFRRQRI